VRIMAFFQGNIAKEKAIELTQLVSRTLSLPVPSPKNIIQNNYSLIPEGLTVMNLPRVGKDLNNVVYAVIGSSMHELDVADVNNVYTGLLRMFLEPLFFNELRTKQQLGYLVWAVTQASSFVDEIKFIIQSSQYDPDYILDRINELRAKVPELIESLTEEDFEGFVKSYITSLSIQDKSLLENSTSYWDEMLSGRLLFKEEKKFIALAKQCTREGLIAYAKKYIPPDVAGRREFVIKVWGNFQSQADADAAGKEIVISDVQKALEKSPFPLGRVSPHKILQPELL